MWLQRIANGMTNRKTEKYLQTATPTSCLRDLSRELDRLCIKREGASAQIYVDQIFSQRCLISAAGPKVWNQSCFAGHLESKYPSQQLPVLILWQMFSFAAYYPFGFMGPGEAVIDIQAFRRAFALLVLGGFGRLSTAFTEKYTARYEERVVRLTRIVYESLGFNSSRSMSQDDHGQKQTVTTVEADEAAHTFRREEIKSLLYSLEPVGYARHPYRYTIPPSINHELFNNTSDRLLDEANWSASLRPLLESFRQLLLTLVSLSASDKGHWKNGRFYIERHSLPKHSIGLPHANFDSTPDIEASSRIVSSVLASRFPNSTETLSWHEFEAFCYDVVIPEGEYDTRKLVKSPFILHFFQLWTAIFDPTVLSRQQEAHVQTSPPIPISVANSISMLNVATFQGGWEAPYTFHANEAQLQSDLQSATLVSDFPGPSKFEPKECFEALTAFGCLHVVLIQGKDINPLKETVEQSLVVFVAPHQNNFFVGRSVENEHLESFFIRYSWHTSVARLEPSPFFLNNGGLRVHRSADGDGLEFRAQNSRDDVGEAMIAVSFKERVVKGSLGEGRKRADTMDALDFKLRLVKMQCYRLPMSD